MSDGDGDDKRPGSQPTRPGWLLPTALFTVAAALIVAGVIFLVRAGSLSDSGGTSNRALIDTARTSEVIGQVSTGLNQVLSYDFSKPQAAEAAGKRWLTGDAPKQYQLLLSEVQKQAAGQQLRLVAKVSTAAMISLRGNTARLLVFIDQSSTKLSTGQRSAAAAQVEITAVHSGKQWKISELKPI